MSLENSENVPLLIVGWDSASWPIVEDYESELPTLHSIIERGLYGDLRTVHPPGTIPGWPCITTGLNPGKINTQSLAPFRKDEFQPNTGEDNVELWDVIDHFGGTSCVVNIPTIVEAYPIEGAMVAGFLSTSESAEVSPPDLFDSLNLDLDLKIEWAEVDREADIFMAAMDIAEKRFELVTALSTMFDWDLFIVNFDAPDRVGHSRLKYMDADHPYYSEKGNRRYGNDLRQTYIRLDDMLGKIVDTEMNVFVISDHGMEPCHYRFNINDWLIDNGYIVLNQAEKNSDTNISTRLFGRLQRFITDFGLIDYIPGVFKRKSFIDRLDRTRHISEANVDWDATSAYMSAVYGGIDIIAENKTAVKTSLTDELESIPFPAISVIDSHDLYHGPNMDNIPDLFLEFEQQVLPTNQVGAASLVEPSTTGGKHSMDGIFAAAGPAITNSELVDNASVMDVMPTALHALGLPIPTEVDGRPLEILNVDRDPDWKSLDIDLKKGRAKLSEKEKREVRDTLEDIGYL